MREPNRILSAGTSLERLLLAAAREERPSADLRRRMQRGIGVGSSLFGIKAAFATAGQVAIVALLAAGISDSAATKPVRAVVSLTRDVAPVSVPVVRDAVSNAAPAPAKLAPVAPPEVAPSLPKRNAESHVPSAHSQLREEIRLLDRVRESLKQQAPRRALSELATYRERFPRGAFQQEASVLRVEALAQNGERARASALARDFAAQHPDSPHLDRVEQVRNFGAPRGNALGAKPR